MNKLKKSSIFQTRKKIAFHRRLGAIKNRRPTKNRDFARETNGELDSLSRRLPLPLAYSLYGWEVLHPVQWNSTFFGATTLSIITISVTTLSTVSLIIAMKNATLSIKAFATVMLSVIMLSLKMISVANKPIMLGVIMLSVMALFL
jgi:hypothetical protein